MSGPTENGVLQKDDNGYPVMGGTSSADNNTIINSSLDPVTRRLLTDASGAGSGITSINGDSTTAQLLVTGTAGTNFAIVDDLAGTHTFNLPVASGTNTGKLSNTDWSTFNGKQASGNYITALTSDVTASGPGSVAATLATVNSNVGTFGSATKASVVTVNGKGLVTAASESTVTPAVGSITGLGTGVATFLATPSSANLASALTDKTGTGVNVFGTSPDFTTGATIGSVAIPTISSTNTFTNKFITPQLQSVADAGGTLTPVSITNDFVVATALSQATTIAVPSGSPVQGEKLMIRLKDNGTARALTWNPIYRASSDLALPTTTTLSKTMYLGFVYNSTDTKWDFVAYLNNF